MVYNYHLIYKTNNKQLNEDLHVFLTIQSRNNVEQITI